MLLSTPAPRMFKPFPRLLKELRLQIWRCAIQLPRDVEVIARKCEVNGTAKGVLKVIGSSPEHLRVC